MISTKVISVTHVYNSTYYTYITNLLCMITEYKSATLVIKHRDNNHL